MKSCPNCNNKFEENQDFCPYDGEVLEVDLESLVGTTLDGQYFIEAFLGGGGMGAVYRARHIMLGDRVAIKVIKPGVSRNPDFLRRFRIEGQAARRFRHPNAIVVHDMRTTQDGLTYMVLEYVEGQSLDKELKKRSRFSSAEAFEILEPIANALNAAHTMGVVHRDLKPENIMIGRSSDGSTVVKLLDLGLAKIQQVPGTSSAGVSTLTVAGQMLGTPYYMSPEQWDGDSDIDGRADIYSLAVVFYEIIAGRRPFTGKSVQNLAREHAIVMPQPLHEMRGDVSEEYSRVIYKALAKDRKDRHATVGDFINELRESLKYSTSDNKIDSENSVTLLKSSESSPILPTTPPTIQVDTDPNPTSGVTTKSFDKKNTLVTEVAEKRRNSWSILIVGLAILIVFGLWFGNKFINNQPANNDTPPKTDSTPNETTETVEALNYWIEVLSSMEGMPSSRKTSDLSFNSGDQFKFHFSVREHGYMYILVSGQKGNLPTTVLTAKPTPNTGVTSNSVEVGKDFVFPGGNIWLTMGKISGTDKCTIIFSSTPLLSPAFLNDIQGHELTTEEHRQLEELRAKSKAPTIKTINGNEPMVSVNLPKTKMDEQTLIFNINIDHK
jgi:eukaryotic-like serine/threonine-protein kinase